VANNEPKEKIEARRHYRNSLHLLEYKLKSKEITPGQIIDHFWPFLKGKLSDAE